MKLGYMAFGNYGTILHLNNPDKPPRGQLLARLGATRATKMYVDRTDGQPRHIGYIVGKEWFTIYEVHRWERKPTTTTTHPAPDTNGAMDNNNNKLLS